MVGIQKITPRHLRGFTLIELMIAVAIIAILTTTAYPVLQSFQARSRFAESYTNLGSLAHSQKAFFAVADYYVSALSEPSHTLDTTPGTAKMDSAALRAAFVNLGWSPDGPVHFDYDTNVCCASGNCFTATAYGDVDGNGKMSMIKFISPSADGSVICGSGLSALDPTSFVPIGANGTPVYNSPERIQPPNAARF